MRVYLVTPAWGNSWIEGYKKAAQSKGYSFNHIKPGEAYLFGGKPFPDIVIHGWASKHACPESFPQAVNLVFMRRYEYFTGEWRNVKWNHVDCLYCVNHWIAGQMRAIFAEKKISVPVHVVMNAVDEDKWTYKARKNNKRIGMACHVHPKKNLPMAMQIMSILPPEYELHIAGAIQDTCTAEYLDYLGKHLKRRVYLYGHIDREELDSWWEQHSCCLSTSISEGNPNNVNEAMMKGIKPVVHGWPGARAQYPLIFNTAYEAANLIQGPIDSEAYRRWARENYSMDNLSGVLNYGAELLEKREKSGQNTFSAE